MSDGVYFPELPLWEDMDFAANCTIWGNWLSSVFLPNPWNKAETLGGSYVLGLELFADSSPVDFYDISLASNMTVSETFARISQWYTWHSYYYFNETEDIWQYSPEFLSNVVFYPISECQAAYCKAMGYTGNADLTGIGVYASYYVEAVLATIYLIAYTIWHLRGHSKAKRRDREANESLLKHAAGDGDTADAAPDKPKKLTLGQRTLDSFRGSLDGFLTASMLMSIAMLIAAVWTSIVHGKERKIPAGQKVLPYFGSALYDMILSLLAASFSIFPVLLLYALMGRRNSDGSRNHEKTTNRTDKHRVWLRRGVLGVMWVLAAAEVYLAPRGESDYEDRHDVNQEANTDVCNQRGGTTYWHAMKAAQVLIIGMPLTWLVLTSFVITGFGIPGLAERPWVRRWRSVWRLGIAWLNMLLMWALLAYFTMLRSRIIEASGGLDDENQWGFGQLLALATWVPVAAEWLYIFIWGIEESLETHMPAGFVATRLDPDLSLFHAATMGVDPFEQQDDMFKGDSKSGPHQPPTMEMMPVQTGYQEGQMTPVQSGYQEGQMMPIQTAYQEGQVAPSVHVTGSIPPQQQQQQYQQQQQPLMHYDQGQAYQQQTPWQQWNSTGW